MRQFQPRFQPADDDLPARLVFLEALEVREVRHVAARAGRGRDFQHAREQPAAPGGIHEQIRLAALEPRGLRERFVGELQAVVAVAFELRAGADAARAEFGGALRRAVGRTPGAGRCTRTSGRPQRATLRKLKFTRSWPGIVNDTPGLCRPMAATRSSMPSRRSTGTTAGTSDSPTTRSGRLPSSNTVTSTPRIASSDGERQPRRAAADDRHRFDRSVSSLDFAAGRPRDAFHELRRRPALYSWPAPSGNGAPVRIARGGCAGSRDSISATGTAPNRAFSLP